MMNYIVKNGNSISSADLKFQITFISGEVWAAKKLGRTNTYYECSKDNMVVCLSPKQFDKIMMAI